MLSGPWTLVRTHMYVSQNSPIGEIHSERKHAKTHMRSSILEMGKGFGKLGCVRGFKIITDLDFILVELENNQRW